MRTRSALNVFQRLGSALAILERKVDPTGMRVLQQPASIGLLLRAEQNDGFVDTRIRLTPNRAELLEGAQHVVVPVGGK